MPPPHDDPGPVPGPDPKGSATPSTPATPDPPRAFAPDLDERGLYGWLLAIALLGVGGVLLGEQELAALMALCGLFVAAQASQLDVRWKPLYWSVAWLVPAGSVAVFGTVSFMLWESLPAGPLRSALIGMSVAAAAISIALAVPAVAGRATAALFGGDGRSAAERTAMRIAIGALMLGLPGWFALRDPIQQMLTGPDSLLQGHNFLGGLFGYVALAFAAVGYGLRRSGREAVDRLGLSPLKPIDAVWIVAGVAAIWALNSGAEAVQRRYFPDLYEQDLRFGEMLAGELRPWQVVLLALNAGIGEEITLRGALQPRLGIALTSALFASLHVQYSWFGMLVIFMLGVTLGLLRKRTSTSVAIVVHTVYDLAALATV